MLIFMLERKTPTQPLKSTGREAASLPASSAQHGRTALRHRTAAGAAPQLPPSHPARHALALTWWEKGCVLLQLHVGKSLLVLENTSIEHCGGTIGFFKRRPLW